MPQLPVRITRTQMRRSAIGVDVTVKSSTGNARYFSPTWSMVMKYKDHAPDMTEDIYMIMYHEILNSVSIEVWHWLAQQAIDGVVTVMCFCKDDEFCHTQLLIQYATLRHPELFTL